MPVTQLSPFRGRVVLRFQTTSGEIFLLRWAHTRIMFRCWILHLPPLSALATASSHPCFWPSPILGLVCFVLASKKERACYNPCGGFCSVGNSQITGGMSYQLIPGGQLIPGFTVGFMTPARFAMDEPRGGHIHSFTFVTQSKLKRWKCSVRV